MLGKPEQIAMLKPVICKLAKFVELSEHVRNTWYELTSPCALHCMLHQSHSRLLLRHCTNCNFEEQAAVLIQMDEDEECRVVQCFQQLLQHRDFWCSLPAVIRCHDDECNAHLTLLFRRACRLADLCPSASAAPSQHMALLFLVESACGELSTQDGQTIGLQTG